MTTTLWDKPEVEYLDGVAHPKVSPKTKHAFAQSAILRIVEDLAGDRGFTGTEWRFRLGEEPGAETAFVPDVAFISEERLTAVPIALREEPPVAPEIAVEVRSPSDDLRFLSRKVDRYLSCGALAVLDVNPANRTIVLHEHGGSRCFGPGEVLISDAIPWLAFEVEAAFEKMDRFDRLGK